MRMSRQYVVVAGLNDEATATAIRFYRAGIPVILMDVEDTPPDIYAHRNFSHLLTLGRKERFGVEARTFADYSYHTPADIKDSAAFVSRCIADRLIPCLREEELAALARDNELTLLCCVSLPSPPAAVTEIYALEGCRAPRTRYTVDYSGMVLYPALEYEALKATMDESGGLFKAPVDGVVQTIKSVGDAIRIHEPLLHIDRHNVESETEGILTGILPSGSYIKAGTVVARVEKGAKHIERLPAQSWAVAGAFLELFFYEKKLK